MSLKGTSGLVSGYDKAAEAGYDEGQLAATVVVVKWSAGCWVGARWGLVTTLSDIITMPPPPAAAMHYEEHYCY